MLYGASTFKLIVEHHIHLEHEYDNTWVCFHNGEQLSKHKNPIVAVIQAVAKLKILNQR